jgi:enolase
MSYTTICRVHAWEALDSRGRPTVACRVWLAGGATGRAIVPAGASTGGHEAHELRDHGTRYGGWGTRRATAAVTDVLAPLVCGLDALDQTVLDAALEAADPDPSFAGLGANAVLSVSLAAASAAAQATKRPLWQLLCDDEAPLLPMPMVNIISGGMHASGAVDIQDVLAVPLGASSFAEAIEWASRVRAATAALLKEQGCDRGLVADEGGLAGGPGGNEGATWLPGGDGHRRRCQPAL